MTKSLDWRAGRRRAPVRPRLEVLEDRVVFSVTINEFTVTTAASQPFGITSGPDGNLWFTEFNTSKIGRLTTSGTFTEFSTLFSSDGPTGITVGSDGALWFTGQTGNHVGFQHPTNGVSGETTVPTASSKPTGITSGPDFALWFTENATDKIGRISGLFSTITEFNLPAGSAPIGVTSGPDGALWFTENGTNNIGRLDTGGTLSEFPVPMGSTPTAITVGPDGALWFTESGSNKIGRLTTVGAFSEFAIPTAQSAPTAIAAGPDGALWFTENGTGTNTTDKIGRLTTSGAFTEFAVPTANAKLNGITVGPDGALWFTEQNINKIGQLVLSGDITIEGTSGNDALVVDVTGPGRGTFHLNKLPPVSFGGVTSLTFNSNGGSDTADVGGKVVRMRPFGQFTINDSVKITLNNVGSIVVSNAVAFNAIAGPDTADRPTALANLTPDEHFVQALYLDELGRAGTKAEIDGWAVALGSSNSAAVAGAIQHSAEARGHLVRAWYQSFLGRVAAGAEEQSWVNQLLQGQSEEQVLGGILQSDEFFSHAQALIGSGTAEQRYVQALYQVLLNRTGSDTQVAGWVNALANGGRLLVTRGFLQSTEFRTDEAEAYYNALLHRTGSAAEWHGWVLSALDVAAMRAGFEVSAEFFSNG